MIWKEGEAGETRMGWNVWPFEQREVRASLSPHPPIGQGATLGGSNIIRPRHLHERILYCVECDLTDAACTPERPVANGRSQTFVGRRQGRVSDQYCVSSHTTVRGPQAVAS